MIRSSLKKMLLLGIALALAGPILVQVFFSVAQVWVFPSILPDSYSFTTWITLSNWIVTGELSFFPSLVLSLILAFVAAILGFVTSFFLVRDQADLLLRLSYLPFVFAPVIYGACLKYIFLNLGLAGTWVGVGVAQFLIIYPFAVLTCVGFWNSKVQGYIDAALTLGAKPGTIATEVLLPVLKSPFAFVFTQCLLFSWFEYGMTYILGLGKVETLNLAVYQFLKASNFNYAAVAGLFLTIPILVIVWLNKKSYLR